MKYVQISADKLRSMQKVFEGNCLSSEITALKKYIKINLAEFDSMNRELQSSTDAGNTVSIETVYKVKCNMTETYCSTIKSAEATINMYAEHKDSSAKLKYLSARCLVEILKMIQGDVYDQSIIRDETLNGCKDAGYLVSQRFVNSVNRILSGSYLETNIKDATAIVKKLLREHEIVEFCRYSNYIKRCDIDKLKMIAKENNDVYVTYGKGDMGHTLGIADMVMRGLKLEDIRDELLDLI